MHHIFFFPFFCKAVRITDSETRLIHCSYVIRVNVFIDWSGLVLLFRIKF